MKFSRKDGKSPTWEIFDADPALKHRSARNAVGTQRWGFRYRKLLHGFESVINLCMPTFVATYLLELRCLAVGQLIAIKTLKVRITVMRRQRPGRATELIYLHSRPLISFFNIYRRI